MGKYYLILSVIFGALLFYIFTQDPCNNLFRANFASKYPDYKILDTGSLEGTPKTVQCRIYYNKVDSDQVYEDIWLYQNVGSGWEFSSIVASHARELVP